MPAYLPITWLLRRLRLKNAKSFELNGVTGRDGLTALPQPGISLRSARGLASSPRTSGREGRTGGGSATWRRRSRYSAKVKKGFMRISTRLAPGFDRVNLLRQVRPNERIKPHEAIEDSTLLRPFCIQKGLTDSDMQGARPLWGR
jgi:hypothetical protein